MKFWHYSVNKINKNLEKYSSVVSQNWQLGLSLMSDLKPIQLALLQAFFNNKKKAGSSRHRFIFRVS